MGLHDAHGAAGADGGAIQAVVAGREARVHGRAPAPGAGRLPRDDGRLHRDATAPRGEVSLAPLAAPEDEPVPMEVAYDADLGDQVFVFTGFRDEVLAARIQNVGGAIRSGISRSVTTLLTADASAAPSGKVRKALEYGIAVRRKADFEREFYIAKTPSAGMYSHDQFRQQLMDSLKGSAAT